MRAGKSYGGMSLLALADIPTALAIVRYWGKADINRKWRNVRF
jgi:hypothetical protein